jgi:hypothetical protein
MVPDISIAMLISAAPRRMSPDVLPEVLLEALPAVLAEAWFEAIIRSRIDSCMTGSVINPAARIHD